jgi:hypothetical protein
LVVEPTFAGDDEVGVGDVMVEVEQVQEIIRPRHHRGTGNMAAKPMPPAAPDPCVPATWWALS